MYKFHLHRESLVQSMGATGIGKHKTKCIQLYASLQRALDGLQVNQISLKSVHTCKQKGCWPECVEEKIKTPVFRHICIVALDIQAGMTSFSLLQEMQSSFH